MADTYGNASTPGGGPEAEPIPPLTPTGTDTGSIGGGTGGGLGAGTGMGAGMGAGTTGYAGGMDDTGGLGGGHTSEARSRFSAALEEAKAGAAELGAAARERATAYREQARTTGDTWSNDARSKAGELADQGKARASDALSSLSRIVSDNAATIDEKLGTQYGDYVRSASRSLQDNADRLNQKSLEELGEDAREFVRSSPAMAVGMAALAGFMFARILRR